MSGGRQRRQASGRHKNLRDSIVSRIPSTITVNGRQYPANAVPPLLIYPFFLVHMLAFGVSGFFLAYGGQDAAFLFMHGGIAITVYLGFYLSLFGLDSVKWMLINAGLGVMGIYSQVGWILARFGKRIQDYPWYVHVIPFLYYVLYTFLLRQMLLDVTGARNDPRRRNLVEWLYVLASLGAYGGTLALA